MCPVHIHHLWGDTHRMALQMPPALCQHRRQRRVRHRNCCDCFHQRSPCVPLAGAQWLQDPAGNLAAPLPRLGISSASPTLPEGLDLRQRPQTSCIPVARSSWLPDGEGLYPPAPIHRRATEG